MPARNRRAAVRSRTGFLRRMGTSRSISAPIGARKAFSTVRGSRRGSGKCEKGYGGPIAPRIDVVRLLRLRPKEDCRGRQMRIAVRRRDFMIALAGVWLRPVAISAQQRFTIGVLSATAGPGTFFLAPFLSKLTELGYQEGKNVVVESRFAGGSEERL